MGGDRRFGWSALCGALLFASCGGSVPFDGASGDRAIAVDAAVLPDLATPDFAPAGLGPPYPIVLVHGMAGFRNIGPLDYFYGVAAALKSDGHDVWISKQDPINDSEIRGAQVRDYVEMVRSSTGKARVNLIGHSQGGFDARWVASQLGNRVATVTTIASPMAGTPIADLAAGTDPNTQAAIDALLNLYGAVNGFDSDAQAAIGGLTSDGAAKFFALHPDAPDVAYFSIAGRSAGSDGGADCAVAARPEFITRYDGSIDPINPLLAIPSNILDGLMPKPVHDGLVPVLSARHGTFLGCIPADHLLEVNQLLGPAPVPGNMLDVLRFYQDLADFLVAKGF